MFYASISIASTPICLLIRARDMMAAMDQVNAWISGFTSAVQGDFALTLTGISSSKPRGIEAQDIHNYVKVK